MLRVKLFFITLFLSSISAFAQNNERPNVIFILTDDQGYGDVGAHGNKVIKTPELDKLHNESIRFTNFHTGTTCAPSRSGIMAGIDGNRSGVWHTVGGCNILRKKYVTMPEIFKQNNYKTAMFGKWHLGDVYPYLPENRGFDEAVYHGAGGIGQTPDYWENDYFDDTYFRNGKPEKFKGYCTDVFFDEAISFIEAQKNSPFFVYISTNAPHGPFNVPEKYFNLYKNDTRITEVQKAYYGMITNIDDNLKKLDKVLNKLKIKDNTILIFMTDNGTAAGYRKKGGVEYGFNANMRGQKGSPYDGGHRVPLFMRWKNGNIKQSVDVNQLTMNYDLLPTLIDLCDLDLETEKQFDFDGISLKPLLLGKTKLNHRYAVVDNNRLQQPIKWRMSAVMDDEWRLINGDELYNITKDVSQKNNLSKKHPKKVKEMRKAYEKWWTHVSKDFSHFEAYIVGKTINEESVLTVHDIHTTDLLAYNQNYVRNPIQGKKPRLAKGYWLLDVAESGNYQIELRRFPKEANLSFNAKVEQLGIESGWYDIMSESIDLNLDKATLDIGGLHLEDKINPNKESVVFNTYLHKGRQNFEANFVDDNNKSFSAFYMYLKRVEN